MELHLETAHNLILSAAGTLVSMLVRRKFNGPMKDVAISKLRSAIKELEAI